MRARIQKEGEGDRMIKANVAKMAAVGEPNCSV